MYAEKTRASCLHSQQPAKHHFGVNRWKGHGPGGFLEERDPPVALLVKRADRDSSDNNRSTLIRGRKNGDHT